MAKKKQKKCAPEPQGVDLVQIIALCKQNGVQQIVLDNISLTFFEPSNTPKPISALGGEVYVPDEWCYEDKKNGK